MITTGGGLFQFERRRIDAVAQALGLRAIREDMAEVAVALLAEYFGALHAVAVVRCFRDAGLFDGAGEAWPAATRIVFVGRCEQRCATACAAIGAFVVAIPVFAGEGRLGSLFPQNAILLWRQLIEPFLCIFDDFGFHVRTTFRWRGAGMKEPGSVSEGGEAPIPPALRVVRRARAPLRGSDTVAYRNRRNIRGAGDGRAG